MTRDEHLFTIAMEECAEVAQRIAKAMRFGLHQVQQDADDQPQENPHRLSNRDRIRHEYFDLRAALGMIGIDAWEMSSEAATCEREKVAKVERYLDRSRRCGTLNAPLATPALLALPGDEKTGWHPIATAPSEQRVLVVLKPQPLEDAGEITFAYLVMTLPDEPEGVWTRDETGESCIPTHWRPLPAAPVTP